MISNYKNYTMRRLWKMFQELDEDEKERIYYFIALIILGCIYSFLLKSLTK